jgi:hypothetical protein
MSKEIDTIIVASPHNGNPKRAFSTWEKARFWRDNIMPDENNITLCEVLLDDLPPGEFDE